jgi:hypothetical protein
MRLVSRSLCFAALCAVVFPMAVSAQEPNCTSVQISPAVLAAAPELRAACVALEQREGRTFAVVNAQVSRAYADNSFELRFSLPGRATARPHQVSSPPQDPVRVGDSELQVQDLVAGVQVALLVDVERPELALEPPAPESPLYLYPLQPQVAAPSYETPSGVWLFGLAALLVGGGLAAYRISRQTS